MKMKQVHETAVHMNVIAVYIVTSQTTSYIYTYRLMKINTFHHLTSMI